MIIREATRDDADDVGALSDEAVKYLQSLGDDADFSFNASTYLRDGFGDDPAFQGLVAEIDDEIVGYLLYHSGYNADWAMRIFYIIDLYVRPANRLQGVGRALMKRAGEICAAAGGKRLYWSVYSPNHPAFSFYERLGAQYHRDMEYMYLPLDDDTGHESRA
jgi:GNAT superfamily N-acetyltransferase